MKRIIMTRGWITKIDNLFFIRRVKTRNGAGDWFLGNEKTVKNLTKLTGKRVKLYLEVC